MLSLTSLVHASFHAFYRNEDLCRTSTCPACRGSMSALKLS